MSWLLSFRGHPLGDVIHVDGRVARGLTHMPVMRFHQLPVSLLKVHALVNHDHLVSEGGVEPLAYILGSSPEPWLSV
jgi:hypothetical protein